MLPTGEMPFLLGLHQILRRFFREGPWEALGANILLVTRFDSYNITHQTDTTDKFPDKNNIDYLTLISPGWEAVFESRKKLTDWVTDSEEKKRKKERFKERAIKIKGTVLFS